ncbi:myotubularin-related protein 4 isoform X2 [Plodia interpunctella]|uniref:myotubularin-related protein 4 isoform X2 n=1 Tax=Plodia interpunctella TaxID=58824 RepID=UPI0023675279|nr:myotubularin-related protein 4 isoform X2 [Plodia interpunctella]
MLINTYLDTEDFVYLHYPEDEPAQNQGCGAGARLASKYPPRPPSPDYSQVAAATSSEMSDRGRYRAPPQPEPPPHRVRAADLFPRGRPVFDEPGLEISFTPICGEFVKLIGRTADGGTIAISNYRLHIQPRRRNGPGASVPLRLIDAVEIRDILHLIVLCKHGRQLKCTFANNDQCLEWWRRLTTATAPMGSVLDTFAAAYAAWAKEQPPLSVHRALMKASHSPQRPWFIPELERLGFTAKNAWRVTKANAEYKLCLSYPPHLIVPSNIGDEDLDSVARFRALRRIPAVVWRHRGNGAVIARSSQPEVGWLGWYRSSEDERLLAGYVSACNADRGQQPANTNNKQTKLLIVDARSYTSAVTNRARGGGCECAQYYPAADIQFMSMPNIHNVRKSFYQMRQLAAEPSDQANWHSKLESTLWLQYISGILRAGVVVGRAVAGGRPALVHCSDGWDRTPQIVATAQLILDPHYRTIEGFRILIEREWLDFGHKFADRCGHQFSPTEDLNERSPIFLQWLDVVHQLMLQYPCSFEFNEAYLIKLATHVHSCMFGTFLCNTSRERIEMRVPDTTAQVWHLLRAPAYRNHLYSPHHGDQVIWPEYSVRSIQLWTAMYIGDREEPLDEQTETPQQLPPQHNGMMTKTRSCDNLLGEEKRTTQRRSSDPSIAPDVMKLSMVVTECDGRRACRAALTDSCVDTLPVLHAQHANSAPPELHHVSEQPTTQEDDTTDQVDGLHPDHFENGMRPRDIASNSSSLEREFADPTPLKAEQGGATGPVDMTESVVRVPSTPDVGTPEEPPVFVCDTYTDVIGMAEVARESARTRNISITWRSISESSNQSSTGFDIPEPREPSRPSPESHTTEDLANHNVLELELTNHNRENGHTNEVNGVDELPPKFLEVDGGATSSSISSESEGEGVSAPRRNGSRARVASQLTLCPTSPRKLACCHCSRRASATSGIETSGESVGSGEACWCGVCGGAVDSSGSGGARCVCGAAGALPDPLDGLPPTTDPLQARLHQIILYQKKVVEELSGQLRSAREALRLASPSNRQDAAASPTQPSSGSGSASVSVRSGSGSGSSSGSGSGSASEVEVGEEARGVVWLPDSAAPRCQYCSNHFWLARRRHHCSYSSADVAAVYSAARARR